MVSAHSQNSNTVVITTVCLNMYIVRNLGSPSSCMCAWPKSIAVMHVNVSLVAPKGPARCVYKT